MRVVIGADRAGVELKEAAKALLAAEHCEVLDVGAHGQRGGDGGDGIDSAQAVAAALQGHDADRGIILSVSGVGASMAANRIPGVRAGLCHDTYSAHEGVEHDDMNVLVLGDRVVGVELARELIHAFLNARFTGEARHLQRLAKVGETTSLENPLRGLNVFGQSVWLDYMRRSLITSGELARLIEEDGLRGVTTNPSIFEKAIAGGSDYKEILEAPEARGMDAKSLYERLAVRDVQDAADLLRPVHDQSERRDGYISLEVSPLLAYDTGATIDEARRLWRAVERDNLMIKVPATPQGIPAVEELIAGGINVNVTLLFARDVYEQIAQAYIAGLERFAAGGGDPARVASVASFFVSRIDTAFDELVAERLAKAANDRERALLRSLGGKVAIANAKLAYERYREIFDGPRWQALAARGARTQRLLWASTSTKNPAYPDVLYVEGLIGPDTVNTIPRGTIDAFRDHGRVRATLVEDVDVARDTMATIGDVGLSLKQVTDGLLADGVKQFVGAFDKLLKEVERQGREARARKVNRMTYRLPDALAAKVQASLADWQAQGKARRLWQRDPSLWTGRDESHWLGWLGITNGELADAQRFARIAEVARSGAFSHLLLLGMGGSSLAPDVFRKTFGKLDGFPELHVLDSTDPAQVKAIEGAIDVARTLFIVSSKSGSTLEPNIFEQYFYERVVQAVGEQEAGSRFIAITDPHSKLQHVAEGRGFRRVFFGWQNIGGRYSALSDFGMVPAAAMGIDVVELLDRTEAMVCACMPTVPAGDNPGVVLGNIIGVAARDFGRDKVTIVASPGIASFGAWLEQLIAESTGKEGKGLVPIAGETPVRPEEYGADRLFVYLKLQSDGARSEDEFAAGLERAGQPVVRVTMEDRYDLGQEMFRWEIATAVAGSIIGIDPFDQPDVEASKTATRKLTAAYEESGQLPAETPFFTGDGVRLYTDDVNAIALTGAQTGAPTLAGLLRAHLDRLRPGDYFALLAYIEMNEAHARALTVIRDRVLEAKRVATCLEFGPRFLHSTGQAYKGGPNSGVFLQITCDDAADLPVPGQKYTFGVVKAAQARGDFEVLAQRGRRVLRVHLGPDVAAGLATLQAAILL
ncbi:MAG TPA: bifunctional transaldolase/phosoglucose isomerase [Polyangia bacterium]|jgi:transaldolase/glucose-6-phosphate isomerase